MNQMKTNCFLSTSNFTDYTDFFILTTNFTNNTNFFLCHQMNQMNRMAGAM